MAACAVVATASYPKVTPDDLKALDGPLTPMGACAPRARTAACPSGRAVARHAAGRAVQARQPTRSVREREAGRDDHRENMAQYAEH